MTNKAIIIGVYAILVLIGGIIGYIAANSHISLIMSLCFAAALGLCAYFMWKGKPRAYEIAMVLLFALLAFFAYRYFISYKIAPAGIMSLITAGVLAYLATAKNHLLNQQ